jgi:hypothetical protein
MATTTTTTTPSRGYSATKDQLLKRLERIEGQVRGIAGMVEEERYGIDVLTQISAGGAVHDRPVATPRTGERTPGRGSLKSAAIHAARLPSCFDAGRGRRWCGALV